MKDNELVGAVADYISCVMHYDCDYEGYYNRPCPFNSFEEATNAYLLHMSRMKSREGKTLDEKWHDRYYAALREKGIIVRKLRPRRGEHCIASLLVTKK